MRWFNDITFHTTDLNLISDLTLIKNSIKQSKIITAIWEGHIVLFKKYQRILLKEIHSLFDCIGIQFGGEI